MTVGMGRGSASAKHLARTGRTMGEWCGRRGRNAGSPFLADLALTTPELLQGVSLPAEESLHRIAELATRLTLHPRQELTGP